MDKKLSSLVRSIDLASKQLERLKTSDETIPKEVVSTELAYLNSQISESKRAISENIELKETYLKDQLIAPWHPTRYKRFVRSEFICKRLTLIYIEKCIELHNEYVSKLTD